MINDKAFITDGILDAKKWEVSHPKILFLLKESTKRSGWTQIAGVPINTRNGDNPRFWPNILRWKHAVTSAYKYGMVPSFPNLEETIEYQEKNGILDDIAYVNVKKSLGETISDKGLITKIATENRLNLGNQLDEINPSVVFCCYTFPAYEAIYTKSDLQKIAADCYLHKGRLVINFYHPSYYARKDESLYEELAEILRQNAVLNYVKNVAPSNLSP